MPSASRSSSELWFAHLSTQSGWESPSLSKCADTKAPSKQHPDSAATHEGIEHSEWQVSGGEHGRSLPQQVAPIGSTRCRSPHAKHCFGRSLKKSSVTSASATQVRATPSSATRFSN